MIMKTCTKCGAQLSANDTFCTGCGTAAPLGPQTGESFFDGKLSQLIGWSILGGIVTAITLGICYPWAVCMVYGWKINHTVIEGRRLQFHGRAVSLFGQWVKWLLLCIITIGIYGFWVGISLEKWKVKNTTFANPI
jgi:uncharacterized membrane protein YjgN (DUF898 family)